MPFTARETASVIARVLASAANVIARGDNVAVARATACQALLVAGFGEIDYLDLRSDPELALSISPDSTGRSTTD